MKTLFGLLGLLLVSLPATSAISHEPQASPTSPNGASVETLLDALRGGGYVIYLRHAATNRNQVDRDDLAFDDCTTQRNLSEQGRAEARAIGAAFQTLGIALDRVISSPYCRARETAMLAFGRTEISDDLRFSIAADQVETAHRAAALRRLLASAPASGSNSVIVAHTANLKDAAGLWPKPEGVAMIFRPKGGEGFEYVRSVLPGGWSELIEQAASRQHVVGH